MEEAEAAAAHETLINLDVDLDLYCLETTMEDGEKQQREEEGEGMVLFWEDEEELLFLSSKQKNTLFCRKNDLCYVYPNTGPFLFSARMEGVNWLLMSSRRLGFTAHTTILAVDYFDRFLSSEGRKRVEESQQPWLTQLCSVACLSLAAKLEETRAPLLLDLQVEETRFVFEAKTIQRMELLVLSTLGWRMNPVTPLSFVDPIARRMAASESDVKKTSDVRHWEFRRRCHSTLLSLIADSRWLEYLPSVLAAATMIYVFRKLQLGSGNQILSLLNTTKEDADGCYQFLLKYLSGNGGGGDGCNKRKHPDPPYHSVSPPSSPDGVIGSLFNSDVSNDSLSLSFCNSSVEKGQL